MITVSIDILTAENVGHDKRVNSFERGFHHVETRIFLYIKLDKLFMYIIDNEILLTIHLIACNYVLLYTYYYLDARIESLRNTDGRLSYFQLKHVSRLEPSTKGAFEVSKTLALTRNCFRVSRILSKKFGRVHYISTALVCSRCQ